MTDEQMNRDTLLQTVARTEQEVQHLSGRVAELKGTIEQLLDRSQSIAVLQVSVLEVTRRVGGIEAELTRKADADKVAEMALDVKQIGYRVIFGSGGLAVLYVILHLLWR